MPRLGILGMFVAAVLIAPLGASSANAQSALQGEAAKRFVGTWRIVSITTDGKTNEMRGPRPTGLIIYDAGGNMAVQIMPDRPRPKFAAAEPTPDEAKVALYGYTAYFGTYSVDALPGTVTHHRQGNINPGGLGDFVRRYEFVGGDKLILRPLENQHQLVWERVK